MRDLIPLFDDYSHNLVNMYLNQACGCPECGARPASLVAKTENRIHVPRYVITCSECKYIGPFGEGLEDAVKRWNKPMSFFKALFKKRKKKGTSPSAAQRRRRI